VGITATTQGTLLLNVPPKVVIQIKIIRLRRTGHITFMRKEGVTLRNLLGKRHGWRGNRRTKL